MSNKIIPFDVIPRTPGNQHFDLILIDGGTSYTLYIKEKASPTIVGDSAQINASGAVPVIAPSGGGDVVGTGTTNFILKWADGPLSVAADSRISDNGTLININSGAGNTSIGDTALIGNSTRVLLNDALQTVTLRAGTPSFQMDGAAGSINALAAGGINFNSIGLVRLGDTGGNQNSTKIEIDDAAETIDIDSAAGLTQIGDINGAGNGVLLIVDDDNQAIVINNGTLQVDTIQPRVGSSLILINSGQDIAKIGDTGSVGNDTLITLDDNTKLISMDSATGATKIGDVLAAANGTLVTVDNASEEIDIDSAAGVTQIGDVQGVGNSTLINVDDPGEIVEIDATNGVTINGDPVIAATLMDGQLLIGDTGGAPVANELNSADGQILITNGAGTIDLGVIGTLTFLISQSAAPLNLTAANSKALYTNEGATALIVINLPAAAAGLTFEFIVQDADGIQIVAGAGDTIRLGTAVSAAAGNAQSVTIGSTVKLVAINATEWIATSVVGTWVVT